MNHQSYFYNRALPPGLEGLNDLALDLRWTWSHFSDQLWERLDPVAWERTGNPYFILQNVSQTKLEDSARDKRLMREIQSWLEQRKNYYRNPGWFGGAYPVSPIKTIAYFSMEFGLSEALPIYSGGLGILAGDHLKASSDLGVPIVGVGLLYQQGYFRQMLSAECWQLEAFPYNDPTSLPVMPVQDPDGGWLRITLPLPGRALLVRVWQAQVGKIMLYLLDSNDPLNSPRDRGLTANLYPSEPERRLLQEMVLGIGGWRVLEELGLEVDVCHLNEGHAAFVIPARAKSFMEKTNRSFQVALWATRAGNVFTTHTPVDAAFDRFEPELMGPYAQQLADMLKIPMDQFMALGRRDPANAGEPFNMAYLATRGCGSVNGVSQLHGKVSREIFQPLFPGCPNTEVPVGHITNGAHMPSWDSEAADALWTRVCGKDRWLGTVEQLSSLIAGVEDSALWPFRVSQRLALIQYVRRRLVRQLQEHGESTERLHLASHVLDPNALTIGFARRFTEYKRPTLLLNDRARLIRLLQDQDKPVQLIIAGKAHPKDEQGKRLVQTLAQFAALPELRDRVVFLEDYEMVLAQEMVAGIDVWLNTPRRLREASGTSGMKILVNGGLNLSELDGWWDEAYAPDVGWALGHEADPEAVVGDAQEAEQLYDILEHEIIPEFYDRDHEGIPRAWVKRVRASMSKLTAQFSSNRMVREYIEKAYVPAAERFSRRISDEAAVADALATWQNTIKENWHGLRFGNVRAIQVEDRWIFEVDVFCGDLDPKVIRVQLFAETLPNAEQSITDMKCKGPIVGMVNAFHYTGEVSAKRPAYHYTPRIIPFHPEAVLPLEDPHILWKS